MRRFWVGLRHAIFLLSSLVAIPAASGQVVVLHSFDNFNGGLNDGSEPYGSLTLAGGNLYGTTYYGGDAGLGSIFQIGTNGTGSSITHSLDGGTADGRSPQGSLLQFGSTLYGMTSFGGAGPAPVVTAPSFKSGRTGATSASSNRSGPAPTTAAGQRATSFSPAGSCTA